jgi:hypothetical protein
MLDKRLAIPSPGQVGGLISLPGFGPFLCNDTSLADWEAVVTSQREPAGQSKRTILWMILCMADVLHMLRQCGGEKLPKVRL